MGKKRKVNKDTQAYKNKIIRRLKNKLLKLWAIKVKERANFKCEVDDCSTDLALNSHHIENFLTSQNLRYDIRNGLCVCQGHHKFFKDSCHRSFIFIYNLMTKKHPEDLQYLLNFKTTGEELTVEILERKIKEMEAISFTNHQKDDVAPNQQEPSVLPLEQK
jgi:hypothetical protein